MARKIYQTLMALTALVLAGPLLAATETMQASQGLASPQMHVPEELSAPPQPTPLQLARRAEFQARAHGHGAIPDTAAGKFVPPMPKTETKVQGSEAPSTFTIFRNTGLLPTTGMSDVNEPSHANSGRNVFYTGNWYAARSKTQGSTWSYINPYADYPDFCCDQDVVYDNSRNLTLWYRQGVFTASGNTYKLGVSLDGGVSFAQYTLTYTNYNGLPLGWFDYPQLALSNNYLYITSNYFNTSGTFQRMMVTRISLDQLQAQGSINFNWWSRTTGWTWSPVQGAREVMYLGDHTSTTAFNVCDQPEANTTLNCRDVAVPAWTSTGRGAAVCTTPNGFNPCARLDQRVNVGYLKRNAAGTGQELGFFWTVAQGAGFNFPYVNAVAMDPATFALLPGAQGRPFIWNGSVAFAYAGAAPNARGHLGISTYLIGGGNYPQLIAGINDDYNLPPPGWVIAFVSGSDNVVGSRWGDYTRVRAHSPELNVWTLSGHVTTGSAQNPRYAVFGRERDTAGYDRFKK